MSTLEQQKNRCAQVVESLNANSMGVYVALTAIYFAVTVTQACIRLLWFDEFITFHVAKLNGVHAIWNALANGVDPNPPLTPTLVMLSMRFFGDSELAVRLPSILAGWIGITCLYLFLSKRVSVVYTAAGVLYFMATAAFDYSFESRSYALILAFCMCSLVAWRATIESRYPKFSAVCLALSLAAGISSNYFAVLAFLPIATGELYRDVTRRKIEWKIWAALVAGAVPLLAYYPLITHAIARFAPYAWNKPRIGVIRDSYVQMVAVNLFIALVIFAIGAFVLVRRARKNQTSVSVLPAHEVIASVMLLLYPVLGYIVAVIRAGMISPRFVLPMCYGFAIAVAVISYRAFRKNYGLTVALLAVLTISFIARESVIAYFFYNQRLAVFRVRDRLPVTGVTVVSDSLLVLPLHHYSSPQVASKIVFPVDFDAIREYKREDSPEQNLWAGRFVFPVPIVPLKEFEENFPNYLIVTTQENWLLQKLAFDGNPAIQLNVETDTKAIGGFFPLSHGEVHYFERSEALAKLPARTRTSPAPTTPPSTRTQSP